MQIAHYSSLRMNGIEKKRKGKNKWKQISYETSAKDIDQCRVGQLVSDKGAFFSIGCKQSVRQNKYQSENFEKIGRKLFEI